MMPDSLPKSPPELTARPIAAMKGRYQLLDDKELGEGVQHCSDETRLEIAAGSRVKRVSLAQIGTGVLLLGGACVVLQRGVGRSTVERHNVAPTSLVGSNHLSSSLSELVGGDRDVHGCIGSAGYTWCASEAKCIRPWEHNLTAEHDFAEHCGTESAGPSPTPPALGSDR